MFVELRSRRQKAGQPPGTAMYTGVAKNKPTQLTVLHYSESDCREIKGNDLEQCLASLPQGGTTWVHVNGLQDTALIEQVAQRFQLHPLTVEDILNIGQRPKVDEFEDYLFITIRQLTMNSKKFRFSSAQLSLVVGDNFLLTFQDRKTMMFSNIRQRLHASTSQRMRQQGSDYLAYRIIDAVVDQYFVVLEKLGDKIETLEEVIIHTPSQHNAHTLYKIKRQLLTIRKAVWPMREALSRLLQAENNFISSFTKVYLHDVYDHAVQAIDTIETFRDITAGILDIYLSSLTIRMNEIMKVLTIIATIFIPITFISSFYGMNFKYMPELNWRWGYFAVLLLMAGVTLGMLYFFHKKKWIGSNKS